MLDVVIIGGGPVGLATALHARRAGLSCALVEQRVGVVDKACGEGLMPAGLEALRALGVDPAGVTIAGIRYVAGERSAQAGFGSGPGRGVRRTTLHAALADRVGAADVELVTGRAGEITQDADGVTVRVTRDGSQTRVHARYLLAADGLHSPTRRALGLERPASGTPRYGLRQHFAVAPWSDHVEVHWGWDAEAYVTPVDDTMVGVAVLTRRRAPFETHLAGFPALLERVGDAAAASSARGAGPLRQRTRRRVAGRVLLVGDASGYVDALTGEGTMLGVAQGAAAVAAARRDDPQAYEGDWRTITRRHTLLTQGLITATRARPVRRLLVPAAATVPWVFGAAVRSIAST